MLSRRLRAPGGHGELEPQGLAFREGPGRLSGEGPAARLEINSRDACAAEALTCERLRQKDFQRCARGSELTE